MKDPRIAAVSFTGSRAGGIALMNHAASRTVPIAIYAEMSSVNPVVLLPNRLAEASEDLAKAYVGSLALGAVQFCTNPGIVLAQEAADLDTFLSAIAATLPQTGAQTMLTPEILEAFTSAVDRASKSGKAKVVARGGSGSGPSGEAIMLTTSGKAFLNDETLGAEIFGPASIVVRCTDLDEIATILTALEGQLTATLYMTEADHPAAKQLLPIMEQLAGRIIANGWPTGVDVTHAMVHGGPFPATSDGRSTSVGTLAIDRFLRPVSYQDFPPALLDYDLRDDTDTSPRRVDGTLSV